MFSVGVALHHYPFVFQQLPKTSNWMFESTFLVHGRSWLRPVIMFLFISQASSASAKHLHAVLYGVCNCAHHQVACIIFAQLALLCLLIIRIIPILPMIRSLKITHTVSDRNHHVLNSHFGLLVCLSRAFSILRIFLNLRN
jgi:hypothetical protein